MMKDIIVRRSVGILDKNFLHKPIWVFCLFCLIFGWAFFSDSQRLFCSIKELCSLLFDLRRHNSFQYVNRGVLTEEFFEQAEDSFSDEAVYLILSNTKSSSSKVISLFTQDEYNHVSISFDYNLTTMLSYNGGNNRYSPGMNPETIEDLLKTCESSFLVYKLPVPRQRKEKILERVKTINREGSSYNILGLILKRSFKPNIMYCSQFVSFLLEGTGVDHQAEAVNFRTPSDFIEQDYYRQFEYCYALSGVDREVGNFTNEKHISQTNINIKP